MPERAILFLAIAQTLIWASASYIFAALLLWWEADFGWSRTQLTGAFTAALLVSAVSAPFVGRLIDARRGALVVGVSTLLAGFLVASLALVTDLWQFYMVWILIGLTISGCLYEPCFAILTKARGPAGRKAIVVITLVAGFASTISFPVANGIAAAADWKTAVIFFGMVSVFVAAPLNYLGARQVERNPVVEVGETPENMAHSTGRGTYMRSPEFWCLGLAFGCGAMLQQMTINHLLPILQDKDVAFDLAVLAAALVGPMQVSGRIAMVVAGERASNHLVAICAFLAMGASAVVLMLTGFEAKLVILFAVFFGAAHGVVSIVRPGLAWEILGSENYGMKSGTLASFFFFGGAIAPVTGSLVWRVGGYDTLLVFLLMLAIGGLVLYLAAQRFSKSATGSA